MSSETEVFWMPIVEAAIPDFKELRLPPAMIDHEADTVLITDGVRAFAIFTRYGAEMSDDPAWTLIEMARVVAPKRMR
jgi:hypothetical protein